MTSPDATLVIDTGSGQHETLLGPYFGVQEAETAQDEAIGWIKALRHALVEGRSLRERFTYRGDSLWWFAELYLHKRAVIRAVLETILAVESLVARERPRRLRLGAGNRLACGLVPQVADRLGVGYQGPRGFGPIPLRERLDPPLRSVFYAAAAALSRVRPYGRRGHIRRARVAAFVHSAFWRTEGRDQVFEQEGYIGPVLREIAERLPAGGLGLIGVGPRTNFGARRWWHPLRRPDASLPLTPVEALAPWRALSGSRRLWRERSQLRRALLGSADLRRAATIRGCDCWPIVREELSGIALLQWPWSARAMDEAAAALDALQPSVVVTYAEAGGWGRALVLEARRRAIPLVGLQHGFIYRHWLNYRHEPDEMAPPHPGSNDAGFPRPDRTLVYDAYAARHLTEAGHFPPAAVAVSGSPRLDALVEQARCLTPSDLADARRRVGARDGQHLVVLATKYREAHAALVPLLQALARMLDVHLVIKCHPAETPEPYERAAAGVPNVCVVGAAADLAALTLAARAIVTVNSTVAIDGMVLDVPALVIGLPNNLSPFVEAGVMAGATELEEIGPQLQVLLYDEQYRAQLAARRRAFLDHFEIRSDGRAARRSAEAVLALEKADAGRVAS